jgi:ubiquinone/menaquinone biosynthesis C-methylase UbiE
MSAAVYDRIGRGYSNQRRADPRIDERIRAAIGDTRSVLNVGAGTGSYEPDGSIAIDPSRTMIDQRSTPNAVLLGVAEALPFADDTFDVALAVITIHHWPDLQGGLAELRRVSRRQVIVTFDPVVHHDHWLISDYVPEIAELAALPAIESLGCTTAEVVEVPWDCTDGFLVAYWRLPERILDRLVRAATSGLSLVDPDTVAAAMERLATDLRSGEWARKHGHLLDRETLDVGLRICS